MGTIAINVLMDPDSATVERARAVNARLRANYPQGFALDASHAPHLTILQQFVRTSDVDAVASAVRVALEDLPPTRWETRATGYYALVHEGIGLVGIVVEPTEELRRVQGQVIDAVARFVVKGSAEAFAPSPDGAPIGQPTVDYVSTFVGPRTGTNYHPHLTVGIGLRDFVERLKAEPFEAFPVRAVSVSLYQLGDYGVAARKIHALSRC